MINENKVFVHDKKQVNKFNYIKRQVLHSIFDIIYTLLLNRESKKNRSRKLETKKYSFSVCAIFKDEELSLKEWIEYHLLLGVDHFYLYNNFSIDNFQEILKPYIESGIVDLIDWPLPPPSQFPAYEDCFKKYRNESKWITFIDLDEYICPFYDLSIKDWIKKFELYPSIVIYWKMFGTSGQVNHDNNKLITEQYLVSWDKYYDVGKVCFNTDFDVADFSNHHLMSAQIKFLNKNVVIPPINEFKKFVRNGFHRVGFHNINDFTIQMNHYWSKSYSSYISNKILRGDVNNHVRNLDLFKWHETHNKSIDYKIWRFMIDLKIRMDKGLHFNENVKI